MAAEARESPGSMTGKGSEADAHAAGTGSPLPARMLEEGYRFDFFQAVRLIEHALAGAQEADKSGGGHARIRFRPHVALAFPPADVHAIDWDEDKKQATITVTFMGLYGVASPLPVYFYKHIAALEEGAEPLRDFLDIFNNRLYALFFQAWKRYRPHLDAEAGALQAHTRVFERLAGLGTNGMHLPAEGVFRQLVAHAGRLAARVRNATGLEQMVTDAFEDLPVKVVENVARWVTLTTRPGLGRKASMPVTLGDTAIVGRKLLDCSGKFRLVLGPRSLAEYRALLPTGQKAPLLDQVVRMYAPDTLDYDLELHLAPEHVPPLKLGEACCLGSDTWLGRPRQAVVRHVDRWRGVPSVSRNKLSL